MRVLTTPVCIEFDEIVFVIFFDHLQPADLCLEEWPFAMSRLPLGIGNDAREALRVLQNYLLSMLSRYRA